jgi:hypothetical protein
MINFPASSNMTDFEIVEIDNERRRKIKERKRAIEFRANLERERQINQRMNVERIAEEERERQQIETHARHLDNETYFRQFANRIIYKVIPDQGIDLVPEPILPLLSPPRPIYGTDGEGDINNDDFKQPEDYNLQEFEIIHHEDEIRKKDEQQIDIHIGNISVNNEALHDTTNTSSSESFNSAKSNNSSISFHTNSPEGLNTDADHDKKQFQSPLPIRYNDITFISKINNYNRTSKGLPRYVISSMRPSYACSTDHDYFICHTCHLFPTSGTRKEQGLKDRNEHPFVRNIKAILQHIRINHCEKINNEDRQLNANAESYILSKRRELANQKMPLLQTKTSIPKSPSESCLNTAWKSNQTEITKEIVNTYYFQEILTQGILKTIPCKGHPKLIASKGPEYYLDLADSVYCACNAKQILNIEEVRDPKHTPNLSHDNIIQMDKKTGKLTLADTIYCSYNKQISDMKRIRSPGPNPILSHVNNIIQVDENTQPTFFHLEKTSILQSHGIFVCPYTYRLELPEELPRRRTWSVGTTNTRSMTKMAKKSNHPTNTAIDKIFPTITPAQGISGKSSLRQEALERIRMLKTPREGWRDRAATTAAKLMDIKKRKASSPIRKASSPIKRQS